MPTSLLLTLTPHFFPVLQASDIFQILRPLLLPLQIPRPPPPIPTLGKAVTARTHAPSWAGPGQEQLAGPCSCEVWGCQGEEPRLWGRHGKAVRECSPEPSCPQPGRSLSGFPASEWLWREADGVPHGDHRDPLAMGCARSVHLPGPCGPLELQDRGPPPEACSRAQRAGPGRAARIQGQVHGQRQDVRSPVLEGPECGCWRPRGSPARCARVQVAQGRRDRGTARPTKGASLLVTDPGPRLHADAAWAAVVSIRPDCRAGPFRMAAGGGLHPRSGLPRGRGPLFGPGSGASPRLAARTHSFLRAAQRRLLSSHFLRPFSRPLVPIKTGAFCLLPGETGPQGHTAQCPVGGPRPVPSRSPGPGPLRAHVPGSRPIAVPRAMGLS